jgi:hypothetical protein
MSSPGEKRDIVTDIVVRDDRHVSQFSVNRFCEP